MKHRSLTIFLSSLCLTACSAPKSPDTSGPKNYADMVIHGGIIYTGLDDNPTIEAVAIVDGVISDTGAFSGLKQTIGEQTKVVDLDNAAMFAGFTDSHGHLLGIGMRELTLNLEGTTSIAMLLKTVSIELSRSTDTNALVADGWIETGWPEDRMPTRHDLDQVDTKRALILSRADGHALVVNSVALDQAGITTQTPDPEGGRIDRDIKGEATGILIDNAMSLVQGLIEQPTPDETTKAYRTGAKVYASYGWTGIHNMSANPKNLSMMESMSDEGELNIRVYNSISKSGLSALEESGPRASLNARVTTSAMKLFVDGALGSRGAALMEPYTDQPSSSGLLLMQKPEAMSLFDRAIQAGIQVNTHAIGDRGNNLILNWYEEAFAKNQDAGDLRWRIEHSQILQPNDIPRFRALGVIPSMQPSHAIGDLHFASDRLGADRLTGAYAWRSLIDAGSVIAGGTDAPVERGDPLIEFYAAISRTDLNGYQGKNWSPEQAVTRQEALKMFTLWPAYASFQDPLLGTIEVGKRADFTIFSDDIMTIPASEIPKASAVMTIVDGNIIYPYSD